MYTIYLCKFPYVLKDIVLFKGAAQKRKTFWDHGFILRTGKGLMKDDHIQG